MLDLIEAIRVPTLHTRRSITIKRLNFNLLLIELFDKFKIEAAITLSAIRQNNPDNINSLLYPSLLLQSIIEYEMLLKQFM